MAAVTVLIPTFDHGRLIRHAIGTALAQTVDDIEVLVVGDGAPDETADTVAEIAAGDERVRWFPFPKGPRHGEVHRARVLEEATGEIVCYLSDDDLWFPDHIHRVRRMLRDADYSVSAVAEVQTNGSFRFTPLNLRNPLYRRYVMMHGSLWGLTAMSHTMEAYRRTEGWTTTPDVLPTGRYFARKFLSHPEFRLVDETHITILKFQSPDRLDMTSEERDAELAGFAEKLSDPKAARRLQSRLGDRYVRSLADRLARIQREAFSRGAAGMTGPGQDPG